VLREDRWTLTANWDVAAKSFRGGARRIPRHEAAIRGASLRDFQLYDTAGDPKQTNNVAADHPEVVARLASQLRALHNEVSQEPKPWSKRTASQTQPNILFLVSEDNGPELGCYGDPYVQTPTLDKLAREGVRFERAFVPYSVCSPSRACFLTGLWPQQNGHLGLATHGFSLYRETASLPSWLGARGYRTGIIGKLHVNPERNFPWHFRAIRSANFGKRNMRDYASKAAEFVASSKAGQPWFLQINFPDAHFPLHRQQFGLPAKPLTGADVKPLPFVGADSPRLRELTADYYNCMSRLDSGVRMVLDTLSAEQREQTMVVYIGDHGAQFSRAKCSVYEAGLRVPMIVHWPNHMRAGTGQTGRAHRRLAPTHVRHHHGQCARHRLSAVLGARRPLQVGLDSGARRVEPVCRRLPRTSQRTLPWRHDRRGDRFRISGRATCVFDVRTPARVRTLRSAARPPRVRQLGQQV
jgi:hypothetical protein